MTTKKKTRGTRKKTTTNATSSRLRSASVTAISRELRRRLADMERRRDAVAKELHTIEKEIEAFEVESGLAARPRPSFGGRSKSGRPSAKRGTRRHRNATSLVEALRKVLRRRTLSVSDLAVAVQEAGYRTTSPNFRVIVNQALINNPDLFERVSRGKYTARP
jgi:hypothetical protein